MGVYVYKSKPSHVAKARALVNGEPAIIEIALYQYAYKPYHWDNRLNQQMHFRSGAVACEQAWARSNRVMPKYGVNASDDAVQAASPAKPLNPFHVSGAACVYDDLVRYDKDVQVLEWLELPKGLRQVAYE